MFKKLDADNSRTLDRGEVETLFKKIGQKKTTQELTAAMRQMDSDGDGTVDFKEFKKWWDVNHTKAWKPHALPDVHGRRSGASHHSGALLFRHQHTVYWIMCNMYRFMQCAPQNPYVFVQRLS